MTNELLVGCKYLAVSCVVMSVSVLCGLLFSSSDTPLHRSYFRYVAGLERRMRLMFIERSGASIAWGQGVGVFLVAALALLVKQAWLLVAIPMLAYAPWVLLEHKRKQRVALIEQKLDGFVVALANALRAAPSAGRALAAVQPTTPAPLDREIELVLREMRVGSTLEQALGNLSARVRSFQLDAAMSALLIGRQTGGNVPQILDSAAATMREMARLQGVLRSKTAEGRAQGNVLAAFPVLLIFGFDFASPGYFKPLTESVTGAVIMVLALGMWLTSVVMTRRIMAVEL